MNGAAAGKKIGVFDSGFGGLHVLRGIIEKLPEYDYVYLGDNARAPYGARAEKEVFEFTRQAVDFLFKNDCELVVLACNTASSEALRKIQQEVLPHYPGKNVLGVLIPFSEEAARQTKNKRVGVMATEGTVRSQTFVRELAKLDPTISVYQKACPLLVPFIEAGEEASAPAREALRSYLAPLMKEHVDTLILGCTHYGILENKIREIAGRGIKVVSEGEAVPKRLKDYLIRHKEIDTKLAKNGMVRFYSTEPRRFEKLGSRFFGRSIKAEKAELK